MIRSTVLFSHLKPFVALAVITMLGFSFLYAALPETPGNLSWDLATDILSWTSTTNPESFEILIYKDGIQAVSPIAVSDGSARSENLHAELLALGTNTVYTARVVARNSEGDSPSELSQVNVKGMANLAIAAEIEYGSDPLNFIFNRTSSTSFTMQSFSYLTGTSAYNHSTYYAAGSLKLLFPSTGQYRLDARHYGASTTTTFSQAMVNGTVYVPLNAAASSDGMDASGNPNADTQNNVLTIVVNPGNTGFEQTYTLRFRRRAENHPASITGITHSGYAFSCVVNGSNASAATINGDNLSSLQDLQWTVKSISGTAYFTGNQMTGLSNGDITVTATLVNDTAITASSGTFSLSGYSDWQPHLGKLELWGGKPSKQLSISPLFSSDPSETGIYYCSIVDDYSTLKLNFMAPPDCQISINGARLSSMGESILRIGPTNPISGPAAIIYTIRVENSRGFKDYVLNIQREVNPRLKYGRLTGDTPQLDSASGDIFGLNSAATDKFTVQAWVRWTVTPTDDANDDWANIAAQTTSGDGASGLFWLQHNNLNSAFEFAIRSTGGRQYVQSNTSLVTIERGVWYLVTGVYDGSRLRLYVDDRDVSNRTVTLGGILATVTAAADFNVGKMPYSTRRFPGNVRNLRIWVGEARSAAQIASDYTSTPLAGSGLDDSDFSWPLNETAVGAVTNGKGGVGLTMTNVLETDFVACCTNNRASGHAMTHRPARIDLGSATSESVVLVQARDYSGNALRFRVLPPLDAVGNVMTSSALEAWDHMNKTWIGSGAINTGVLMDNSLGNPDPGTYFWVPVRRNTSSTGAGRYVDDDSETGYDGTDADAGTRTNYNSIMPLPGITAMTNPWTISGNLTGTATYPTTQKYVILGYDQTTAGTLIAACSTPVSASKDGKGTVTFNLNTDLTLKRIEVRTQDDVLITQYLKPEGWSTTATLEPQTLPIVLSGFLVTAQGDQARIQWNTASETNMQGFRVYRHNLEDLSSASIISPLIEASNTAITQSYLFIDIEVPCAGLWYYWLEALEMDGNSQFYGPVAVFIEETDNPNPPTTIIPGINSIYPNPFGNSTQIKYGLEEAENTELKIFNLRGQVVKSWSFPNQARGTYSLYWEEISSDLPNGVYILQFKAGRHRQIRKITLLK